MVVVTLSRRTNKITPVQMPIVRPIQLSRPDYKRPDNINPNQRVVIMAAGVCRRWNNYLGIPKQLAPVNGEPIIKRTIRLLKERGISDIWVTVRTAGQYGDLGVREYVNLEYNQYSIDRIYGARELSPAIYLYGDVYYTEPAIDTILTDTNDFRFFGRRHAGIIKNNREIYAIKANSFIIQKAEELREMHASHQVLNSLGGHLLIHCLGIPINKRTKDHTADDAQLTPMLTDIDDETTDFDYPGEYIKFLKILKQPALVPIKKTITPQYIKTKPVRNYYTIDRLTHDLIHEFLPKIPDVDLIVGIPRDGMLIAYLVSIYRNIPFTDLDSFISGHIYQSGIKHRKEKTDIKRVLVVDDICASGNAMKDAKSRIPSGDYQLFYGAVYVSKPDEKLKAGIIDCYGCELIGPRHYQWTHCDAVHLPGTMMDIDGILCPDWDGGDDNTQSYVDWLQTVPLKIKPQNIGTLITWRREEHRAITEAWLAIHGISYGQLIMCNRNQWASAAEFKASFYGKSDARLFIESSAKQAERIYQLTKRPVVAFDTNEAWGLDE
ncbi:MAG: phosphoribosyltransferase family protein [Dehalococcoides mccartyi]|uniref:phosphoribosyltransferase family protein n=1 Tax=Dehalococcoides mccartyi TaxID=61435 RepID=UPI0030FB4E05